MTRADLEHKDRRAPGGVRAEKLVFGELSTGLQTISRGPPTSPAT